MRDESELESTGNDDELEQWLKERPVPPTDHLVGEERRSNAALIGEIGDSRFGSLEDVKGGRPRMLRSWVYDALVFLLNHMCVANDPVRIGGVATIFTSLTEPNISFYKYQQRIIRWGYDVPALHIIAVIYLDRMMRHPTEKFVVNSFSVHRAYLTCIQLAGKYFSDHRHTNGEFAWIGALRTEFKIVRRNEEFKKITVSSEMDRLEVEALRMLGWDLNVSVSRFDAYVRALECKWQEHCASLSRLTSSAAEEKERAPSSATSPTPSPAAALSSPDASASTEITAEGGSSEGSTQLGSSPHSLFTTERNGGGAEAEQHVSKCAP